MSPHTFHFNGNERKDQAILFFLYPLSELCGEFIFTAIEAKSKAFLFFLLEFYGESIPYSSLIESTGLAQAALSACEPTVNKAITNVRPPAKRNEETEIPAL